MTRQRPSLRPSSMPASTPARSLRALSGQPEGSALVGPAARAKADAMVAERSGIVRRSSLGSLPPGTAEPAHRIMHQGSADLVAVAGDCVIVVLAGQFTMPAVSAIDAALAQTVVRHERANYFWVV